MVKQVSQIRELLRFPTILKPIEGALLPAVGNRRFGRFYAAVENFLPVFGKPEDEGTATGGIGHAALFDGLPANDPCLVAPAPVVQSYPSYAFVT